MKRKCEKGKESFKIRLLKGSIAKSHKKWRESIKGKLYIEKKFSQIHYKLHDKLSSFFRNTLKKTTGTYKKKLTMKELTGLNKKDLVAHIENQWEPGMNWSNHTRNGWHIDHRIPVDYFIKNFDYSGIKKELNQPQPTTPMILLESTLITKYYHQPCTYLSNDARWNDVQNKLNIKVLSEEAAWEKKHPNIAKRIKKLEGKINELKSRN